VDELNQRGTVAHAPDPPAAAEGTVQLTTVAASASVGIRSVRGSMTVSMASVPLERGCVAVSTLTLVGNWFTVSTTAAPAMGKAASTLHARIVSRVLKKGKMKNEKKWMGEHNQKRRERKIKNEINFNQFFLK
jgi:hypothetical protein